VLIRSCTSHKDVCQPTVDRQLTLGGIILPNGQGDLADRLLRSPQWDVAAVGLENKSGQIGWRVAIRVTNLWLGQAVTSLRYTEYKAGPQKGTWFIDRQFFLVAGSLGRPGQMPVWFFQENKDGTALLSAKASEENGSVLSLEEIIDALKIGLADDRSARGGKSLTEAEANATELKPFFTKEQRTEHQGAKRRRTTGPMDEGDFEVVTVNGAPVPGNGLTAKEILRNSPEARAKAERAAKRGVQVGPTNGNDGSADRAQRKQRARNKSGQFVSADKSDKGKGGGNKPSKKDRKAAAQQATA